MGLWWQAARAQPGPPPGGFVLREVAVLGRVPEPAGGLIPYRQGSRWGFADSLGRVWIQPVLADEPTFFARGLASVQLTKPIDARTARILGTVLLNARGECLRVAPDEVALLQPDSTLTKRPAASVVGQRTLEAVYFAGGPQWGLGRARPAWPGASYRAPGLYVRHQLAGRHALNGDSYSLHAASGRALSGTRYSSIHLFQGPWGRFEGENFALQRPGNEQGMLNGRGQEVGGRFYRVYRYDGQLAEVQRSPEEGTALLDTAGRLVLGPSTQYAYSLPDSAGLVRRATLERREGPLGVELREVSYAFVRLDGQLAFPAWPTMGFTKGFGMSDRPELPPSLALVSLPEGSGVLDRTGHWRVPPRYQGLQVPGSAERPRTSFYQPRDSPPPDYQPAPYPEVLLAYRAGKVGMVRLRDGREVVPPRYDEPTEAVRQRLGYSFRPWPLRRGFGCLLRDGQPYLLNERGQEIAPGLYQGWDFWAQGRRYLYLELDKPSIDGGSRWALVDTAGQPLLPPPARPSVLRGVTPAGLVLVQYLDETPATVLALNPQGQPVLTGNLVAWRSLLLSGHPSRTYQLLDAGGRALPTAPLCRPDSLPYARLLLGHRQPPGTPGDSLLVLDGRGRRWATLPPTWQVADWSARLPAAWRGRLLPVTAGDDKRRLGYLLRGGRALWVE